MIRAKAAGAAPGFTVRDEKGDIWFSPRSTRAAIPSRRRRPSRSPRACSGHSATTRSRAISRRSVPRTSSIDDKATVPCARPSAGGSRTSDLNDVFARAEQERRRVVSGDRRDARLPGRVTRRLQVLRHPSGRPQRHRAARAPPRAARAAGVRRLDEPRRHEGGQHARHGRDRGRPPVSCGITCRTSDRRSAPARSAPRDGDEGYEYLYEGRRRRKRLFTLGFYVSPGRRVDYEEHPEIGKFDGRTFEPEKWKPRVPVAALLQRARRRHASGRRCG